ncbi:hypothetical protein L2E82_29980 [Cichorium intybus]|uniref:Uncharacterized protein n=1 Tax=Cichorium intybus TaxID=13427 RepID=A0ACB9CZG7_CICIN|nr:hypothetical protein L2E82_29980 [Cichorium intybus]
MGSMLSGRIPDLNRNCTNLTRLDMQGTSMEGPIPSTTSLLTNLKPLRIFDLAGSSRMTFPNLQTLTSLTKTNL